ncbi:MAG: hypothetical protein WKF73_05720 [Nocardioidaceae bacterium]
MINPTTHDDLDEDASMPVDPDRADVPADLLKFDGQLVSMTPRRRDCRDRRARRRTRTVGTRPSIQRRFLQARRCDMSGAAAGRP